jgi:hypothetical protein
LTQALTDAQAKSKVVDDELLSLRKVVGLRPRRPSKPYAGVIDE